MDGSISLGRAEHKALLEVYRTHPDPAMRRRAHFILLLGDGRQGLRAKPGSCWRYCPAVLWIAGWNETRGEARWCVASEL